jgi:hypothetical protein
LKQIAFSQRLEKQPDIIVKTLGKKEHYVDTLKKEMDILQKP